MLNTAILIAAVLVIVVSLKKLGRILSVGSPEAMLKRHEDALTKLKEDLKHPNSKGFFALAWLFGVLITTTTTALAVYILTNILNFA